MCKKTKQKPKEWTQLQTCLGGKTNGIRFIYLKKKKASHWNKVKIMYKKRKRFEHYWQSHGQRWLKVCLVGGWGGETPSWCWFTIEEKVQIITELHVIVVVLFINKIIIFHFLKSYKPLCHITSINCYGCLFLYFFFSNHAQSRRVLCFLWALRMQ